MLHLINKYINEVYINDNKDMLSFIAEYTPNYKTYIYLINYLVISDCCSDSYIEHITNIEFLHNKVNNISIHKVDEQRDGELKIYNFDIVTDLGICTVEFRNESNGYYGGDIEFRSLLYTQYDRSYVIDPYIKSNSLKLVTKDF